MCVPSNDVIDVCDARYEPRPQVVGGKSLPSLSAAMHEGR